MVNSQFGAILKEFETFFNCNLEPDENDSCMINMGIGISVQIELDRYGFIVLGCRLGSVPMGSFRNDLVKKALISNDTTLPSTGIIGFSQKSSQFILYSKISPNTLTPAQILALLPPFAEKAKLWTECITKGELPPVADENSDPKKSSGIFGLISGE